MIQFNSRKVIKLNKMDAAIVLTEDGRVEASLPEIETDTVPEHVLVGAAMVAALTNPALCKMMRDHFLRGPSLAPLKDPTNNDLT